MVRTLIPRVWRPLDLMGIQGLFGPRSEADLDSVLGSDPFGLLGALSGASEREGFLALDLWESPTALQLEVDLPGVRAEDVDVQVHAGELTLRVARRDGARDGERWLRRERGTGSFTRSFTLPADVDAGAIDAQLADGVLRVTLPKSPRAQPRSIQVKTARP